ncbi:putative coiled-coil domain-containing protein 195 isoform X2 [Aphelocoma coerulescens]|uniref:putative coiled-coil domain-containing protein 195 isoform X2 n=1 Tax=Aphelocoma coerulescens TaxID=39617 RepID=UPI0036044C2A
MQPEPCRALWRGSQEVTAGLLTCGFQCPALCLCPWENQHSLQEQSGEMRTAEKSFFPLSEIPESLLSCWEVNGLKAKDTAMTVRRYPTVSPAPAPSSTRSYWAGRKPPSHGLLEVPGSAQPPAPPAAAQLSREEEKGLEPSPASCLSYSHSSNMKLFQEHVCKCRGKVKAVSFLLPMDMSAFAEKQGSPKSPQNQSTKHLMTIIEKDM